MWQLHSAAKSSHNIALSEKYKGSHTPVIYKGLKLISWRYLGLTYKDTWILHTIKCIQCTIYCTKWNN